MELTRVLKRGTFGEDVAELQRLLNENGFPTDIDGAFGPGTERSVRNFQNKVKILVDGAAGLETWNRLHPAPAEEVIKPKAETAQMRFIRSFGPMASDSMLTTGVPASVILAQAILESGWGKAAVGNNFFGIKADSKWNGPRQLIRTREILKSGTARFPEIISKTKNEDGTYTYIVKDWFRAYHNPLESFTDHALFLKSNSRYKEAFKTTEGLEFADAIAKAGYATDPHYATSLRKLITTYKLNEYDV